MGSPLQDQQIYHSKMKNTSYKALIQDSEFKELIRLKKRFILPMIIFFFVFYFALPFMAAYSNILTNKAIGEITWAWVYALLQFVMVWIGGYVYVKKSKSYDHLAERILNKYKGELQK